MIVAWRNRNTKTLHAHPIMTGLQSGHTGCGRYILWSKDIGFNRNFEYVSEVQPGDKVCKYCVGRIHSCIRSMQEWLDEVGA